MKKVSLSGSLRKNVGKKDAKELRRNNRIPAVMYGGKEQIHFSIDEKAFEKSLHSPESFIYEIDIDGTQYHGVIYEKQFHPVTDRPLHVDFRQVNDGVVVRAEIPFRLTGTAVGVTEGGFIYKKTRKLIIEGLVEKMPEYIDIDVTEMKIGDSVHIRDIKLDGMKILSQESVLVITVKAPKAAVVLDVEDEDEEEGEEEASTEE